MHECKAISPLMIEMQVARSGNGGHCKGRVHHGSSRLRVPPRGRERVGKIQVEGGTRRLSQAYVTT